MKQGFMLIELIIATLIASMVAGVLFAVLFQSTRVQISVDNVIDLSVRVGVIANQLEKDLSGCFLPSSSAEAPKDGKGLSREDNKQVTPEGAKKEASKPIEKIFYSTNKNGQLDTLTFVTNNPLVVYVGKDVGVVKPKVVRVQYTLRPEAEKKDSYALLRQESMELDLENYKNVTPYEVIGGIKSCTVIFTARVEKSSSASAKATADTSAKEKVSYEYKTLNEWTSEQKKEEDKEKTEFPRIPYNVEMKLVLWDRQDKKEKEFTIVCEIPTDFSPAKKQDKKEPAKPKQEEESVEDKNKLQPQKVGQNKRNTKEIIRIVDASGKILFEAEKNDASMKEVAKMLGHA